MPGDPLIDVFVTGALHVGIGKLELSDRLAQTQRTIDSLAKFFPTASIFYIDAGASGLLSQERRKLTSTVPRGGNVVIMDLSAADEIRYVHDLASSHELRNLRSFQGYYKSAAESMALALAFRQLKGRECANIIKLSGRYWAEPQFRDVLAFFAQPSSPAFGALRDAPSYLRPRVPGFDRATSTITWLSRGFDKEFLESKMLLAYSKLQERIMTNSVIDLEHAFQWAIELERVERFKRFGISGILASTGRKIRV